MWEEFFALCDCVPLNTLAEAGEMFAAFETIDPERLLENPHPNLLPKGEGTALSRNGKY